MLGLVLTSALAAVTSAELQLRLTAVKSNILVGEFTKVRLQWTVLKPIKILRGSEVVLIDDGTGFHEHIEDDLTEATTVAMPIAYDPGETALTEYRIGLEPTGQGGTGLTALAASLKFAFPHPGRYRVKVKYGEAESNEVQIDVAAPSEDAMMLFQSLAQQPLMLTSLVGAEKELFQPADGLIAQYGAHPYLAPVILERTDSGDRDDFDRLMALDFNQSAFADERLLRIAERGGRFLGEEFERQTLREVIDKFPGSLAAKKAAILLDSEPPTLTIAAAPTTLWPPNHKLVAVAMTIEVTDNVDPNPTVKLESITCDDGCNPSTDVSDAALNTDDRQFQLRAERLGTGSGRTYTITYSATGASGNTATKTTTVTVPHDQRTTSK